MYYASVGYLNQKGISKWADENYDRYNLLQNVRYKASNWLELGLNTNIAITDQKTGGLNNSGTNAVYNIFAGDSRPTMPVYHPDGNFSGKTGEGSFTNLAAWQSLGGNAYYRNHNIMATGLVKIKPLAGLTIDGDYTYRYYNYSFKNFKREYMEYDAAGNATPFTHTSPNAVSYTKQEVQQNTLNLYANYEKKFLNDHKVKLLVGYNQESYLTKSVSLSRANLISNDIPYLSLATGDRTTSDGQSEWTTRGAFFRVNYDYKEKYLFTINGRYDGSSRFPKDDRFAFFGSYSAAWRLSKEKFWQPIESVINNFKIRGSYGSLGNQVVSSYYPYILTYTTSEAGYMFNGSKEMQVVAPGLVSDNLTWETVSSWDIGLEMGLLDNRLKIEFDYYQRDTKDMLTKSKTLPAILAVTEPQANAADLRATGWELTLDWKQRLSNGFAYQLTGFLYDSKAWITKYDNPTKSLSDDYYVGKRMGEIWGFVTDGFFKTDEEAASWDQSAIVGYTQYAGDLKLVDLNGDEKIDRGASTVDDPGDRKIIGNSTPRYNFTLRGTAEWKGFDLTVFFQGTLKRDVNPGSVFYKNHYTSQWAVPQKMNYDYWREDNPDAFFPRARLNGTIVNQNLTHFLQNGAYIRWKQLSIGYTIPYKFVSKAKLSKVRVYFDANNLWEHSKLMDGLDPEISTMNLYPFTRSYSFGANITF